MTPLLRRTADASIFLCLTVPFVMPNPGIAFLQPLRLVHLYIHATLFFGLGLFWASRASRSLGWVLPLLAVCLEGAQYWIPTRHFSLVDMSFNVFFSSMGYLLAPRILWTLGKYRAYLLYRNPLRL